jgi:hypothetical protein
MSTEPERNEAKIIVGSVGETGRIQKPTTLPGQRGVFDRLSLGKDEGCRLNNEFLFFPLEQAGRRSG